MIQNIIFFFIFATVTLSERETVRSGLTKLNLRHYTQNKRNRIVKPRHLLHWTYKV